MSEHERVVRNLEEHVSELEGRLNAALRGQETRASQEERLRATESALHQVEARLHGVLAENKRLEAQLHQADGEIGDIVKLQKEFNAVTDKCRKLVAENRHLDGELQAALLKIGEHNDSHHGLLHERNLLVREVSGLEKELVQGAAGVRAVKAQMQVRISELENELKELIATLRAKDELIASLRSGATDFELLKTDTIKLIRETERNADTIRSLELELRDFARLRQEVSELRIENERLLLDAERYYRLKEEFEMLLAENERLLGKLAARPMLGVEIKMLDDAVGNRDCVVVVHTITPRGPADVAGIRGGDILKEWDGILLDSKAKFQQLLDRSPPGTRVVFTVVRGNSVLDIPLTVGAAPVQQPRTMRRVRSETQVDNVVQDSRGQLGAAHRGQYFH